MREFYIAAALSYIPSVLVLIAFYALKKNALILAPGFRINYTLARWTPADFYSAAIWIGSLATVALSIAQVFIRDLHVIKLAIGPTLLTVGGTIALLIEHFRLTQAYKDHSALIKTLVIASAVYVGYKATAVTNAVIAELTTTNAANFPDAQKIITIGATVAIWAYGAIIISLLIYVIVALIALFKMVSHDILKEKETRYHRCLIGRRPASSVNRNRELLLFVSLILGAAITVSAPLAYVKTLKSADIENLVKDLIVETSHHLSPTLCGVDLPKDSKMSLLPFRQASVAIPDENGQWKFVVIECDRQFSNFPKTVRAASSH